VNALREGLEKRDAADLIHALMSPEVYRLLVVDKRWSPQKYEQWLAATLVQQLT
ncbi:MAG: TetR/AcrR family transcriptional regulator, partial [Acidimicrobiia bacterium]|nr:TetR/AcrR family transcriptional regulator [Acidimicrobiia bacterium]